MDDQRIVSLYWSRDEQAIAETASKYGSYCFTIANNILSDRRDSEECVNDTYLAAWNGMPPHRPAILSAFLGRITRRLSLKKWRDSHAQKRDGGQPQLALGELLECIPSGQTIDDEINARELAALINTFIRSLSANDRRIFVCRYWYMDSIADISRRFDHSESKVKVTLHRMRNRLLVFLRKEGVFIDL